MPLARITTPLPEYFERLAQEGALGIAIVAGMTPIAFGRGAGSGSRASMAVTIIGGQVLCLLLTLLITLGFQVGEPDAIATELLQSR